MNKHYYQLAAFGCAFILLVGLLAQQLVERNAKHHTQQELALFLALRHAALSDVFASMATEVKSASHNHMLPNATHQLSAIWRQLSEQEKHNLLSNIQVNKASAQHSPHVKTYLAEHQMFEPYAKQLIQHFGYYDLFLISPEGDVVYSYAKEADFGSNLKHGPYAQSSLADVFNQAMQDDTTQMIVSDYRPYAPSQNIPAIFCAHPVIKNGKTVGVMALQIPTELINQTMKFSAGMGKTGETYLVGQDYLMRSQSRFTQDDTVLKTKVETKAVKDALNHQTAKMITKDYRGIPVFSSYMPFQFGQQSWVMLAEKDVAEVVEPIRAWWLKAILIALMSYLLILFALFNDVVKPK